MEDVLDAMRKLGPQPQRGCHQAFAFNPRVPVVVDAFLPTAWRPRALSRRERLRVWFEDLVDAADMTREVYPWKRVQRTELVPAPFAYYFRNGTLLLHPARAATLLQNVIA